MPTGCLIRAGGGVSSDPERVGERGAAVRKLLLILVVSLVVVGFAAPALSAKQSGNVGHKALPDTVHFTGEVRYGAIEARTGEWAGDCAPVPGKGCVEGQNILGWDGWVNLMDPGFNKCYVTEGTLEWIGKNTALLTTIEDCSPRTFKGCTGVQCPKLLSPTVHHKIVHITKGGALKMTPNPGFPTMWQEVPRLTGCALNGTFPIYHGHFDGETLYASAHFNSICHGGEAWSKFGVGAEDGPIHVTFEFDLAVVDD